MQYDSCFFRINNQKSLFSIAKKRIYTNIYKEIPTPYVRLYLRKPLAALPWSYRNEGDSMAKTTQQRRNEIYRIIVSQGSARVSELAEQLQVTTETIRKDLNSMDEQGIIIKNHGGAEIKNTYYQLPLDVKMSEHVYEKQLIARRALDFIQDNTVLFLDPGSTILYLAKYLRLRKGLTVVTNSLAIASMVSETTHQLMIAGGLLQKQGKAAIGGFTNSMIDAIHIDTAFMGCDGFLDSFGPATFSHEEIGRAHV